MPRSRGHWGRGNWRPGYWRPGFPHTYNRYKPGNIESPFLSCRWFPWLPRRWWTGIYGPISARAFSMSKEQETTLLTEQMNFLKQEIDQIKKRLQELK